MKTARLLKFRLIDKTNFTEKRVSVKCPIFNDWKLFVWNVELPNTMFDQVQFILCNRFGFKSEEIIGGAEDDKHYYVMITDFERRIIKEKNH